MTVKLVPITENNLSHIAANLRARDAEEIFCTRWTDDPAALTAEMMFVVGQPNGISTAAILNGVPAAVVGAIETWPGTWEAWAFGTDAFDQVALSLTKWCHRIMIPGMLARGMRRAQCRSMVGHDKAHEWLRSFGARIEDERPMRAWGKNGEDFIMFEWHRADLLKTYTEAA